jgi:hypothetical protein
LKRIAIGIGGHTSRLKSRKTLGSDDQKSDESFQMMGSQLEGF